MAESYRLFLKDASLLITDSMVMGATALEGKIYWPDLIEELQKASKTGATLYSIEPRRAFEELRTQLRLIRAAGGIVWNGDNALLMIYRRGHWDLPKGKIEPGEPSEIAALREVEEECGVNTLRLIEQFDTTYHVYKEKKEWLLKETTWYTMVCEAYPKPVPQKSEGIVKAEWVKQKDIFQKLKKTYPSIQELLKRLNPVR